MEDLFQKFKKQFVNEIQGLLETLETDLLSLEKNPSEAQLIDSVFRAMHTIKGTSAMYGCKVISDFTHHLENIYQIIRDTNLNVDHDIIDISLASLDHIRNLIVDEKLELPHNIAKNEELLKVIGNYSLPGKQANESVNKKDEKAKKAEKKTQSWYILLKTDEQIYFRGVSIVNMLSDLSTLGTYYIHRVAALCNNDTETWGIVLISTAHINDIREVFMFIEDNCTFVLIKEGNLHENEDLDKFVEKQAELLTPQVTEQIPFIPPPAPIQEKLPTDKKQEPDKPLKEEKPSVRSKTSILVAEAAKQNLNRITVDSSKLDYLMYLVSELITLNSQLLQTTRNDYYEEIRPHIEKMESLTKLFRTNALEIRLVPLSDMVIKFQRLIRDLSKHLNKNIEFITHGTDTELDKNTIDLIAEPIIHIVRNCVDHGIESVEERIKKGKPETGTIRLTATHVGNYVQIVVEDDGAGLDLDKIKNKAIEKGIIKKTDILTKTELSNLIFHSGLSTSENITDVSGRGVGMDVVKRKIAELRGEIFISTEKDKGTSFTLKIQQSIAIIDTLLFRVQKTFFILPLTDIEICKHAEKTDIINNKHTGTIDYNGQLVPFIDLREHFTLGGTYPETIKLLILKEGGQYIGLLSDEILGEQQAVLKPLGQAFDDSSGILAVSQHGNGQWAYMLNANYLHKTLKVKSTQKCKNMDIK